MGAGKTKKTAAAGKAKKPVKKAARSSAKNAKSADKKSPDKSAASASFALSERLDITYVHTLHAEVSAFLEKLPDGANVALDGSKVERITTPCVQLLLSLGNTCQNDGRGFAIKSASDVMHAAFADLGFQDQLNQWGKS